MDRWSKGGRIAFWSGSLAVAAALIAGVAGKEWLLAQLREEWRLWRMEHGDVERRDDYRSVLGTMGSKRAVSRICSRSDNEKAFGDLQPYFFGLQFHQNQAESRLDVADLLAEAQHPDRGRRCRAAMLLAFAGAQAIDAARARIIEELLQDPDPLVQRVAAEAKAILGRGR